MKGSRTTMWLAVSAAVLVALFVVGSRWYEPEPAAPAAPPPAAAADVQLVRDYSPVLGAADAPVTIVEFFDPECESCAAMYPIVKDVMREFEGRTRLVVRYMPLHGNSAYAAGLLEASRPHDRYWPLLETFLLRQPEWADHRLPRPDLLRGYVRGAGLDDQSLEAAARSPEITARITQDAADGRGLGVRGTPTFFINGRMLMQLGHAPLRMAVVDALASSGQR